MPTVRVNVRVNRASLQIGQHLLAWRKLQGLTAAQVSDRAGISRGTLHRLEAGDPAVGFAVFLNVARALGVLDSVVGALDPFETELGRARSTEQLPTRVRS